MTRTASANYTESGEDFYYANADTDAFDAADVQKLAKAVENHTHASGRGAAITIRITGEAQGDIIYHNGTTYTRLGAGTNGQFLKTQGAAANPTWASLAAGDMPAHATRHDAGGADALSTVPDHDHSGDAGDGGEIGSVLHGYEYASGSSITINKGAWATICSVSFTPVAATDLFYLIGSAVIVHDGTSGQEARAIIDRTAGVNGTILQPTAYARGASGGQAHSLTPIALFIPADTGAQTFALRGYQNSDDGGNTATNSGSLIVIRLRAPAASI